MLVLMSIFLSIHRKVNKVINLRKLVTSTIVTGIATVAIGMHTNPAIANPNVLTLTTNPSGKVRVVKVQGFTYWTEVNDALYTLRAQYGIPITGGVCDGTEVECITLTWYNAADGAYGWGGKGTVKLNRAYEPGRGLARKTIVIHELGHALGLPHSPGKCKSVMSALVAVCAGSTFTKSEHARMLAVVNR